LGTATLRIFLEAAAKEEFGKVLRFSQAIGDRAGEATDWHNLAEIDLKERNYSAAREKSNRSLQIRQTVGDRAGEAAKCHQLAVIDMYERQYSSARKKLGKALQIRQEIGDRAGEASTWRNLGLLAWETGRRRQSIPLMVISLAILFSIGSGDTQRPTKT
jgi:tetratricopeptide (TPR) repeat protein